MVLAWIRGQFAFSPVFSGLNPAVRLVGRVCFEVAAQIFSGTYFLTPFSSA
jgi:hypothetical protein